MRSIISRTYFADEKRRRHVYKKPGVHVSSNLSSFSRYQYTVRADTDSEVNIQMSRVSSTVYEKGWTYSPSEGSASPALPGVCHLVLSALRR